MFDLTLIPFGDHSIRITGVDGEPWFVLKDVLAAIRTKSHTPEGFPRSSKGLETGTLKTYPFKRPAECNQRPSSPSQPPPTP